MNYGDVIWYFYFTLSVHYTYNRSLVLLEDYVFYMHYTYITKFDCPLNHHLKEAKI